MGYILEFTTAIADVVGSLVQLGLTGEWHPATDANAAVKVNGGSDYFIKESDLKYPILQISPEVIFSNKMQMTDANFISNLKDKSEYRIQLKDDSALKLLRDIISGWYVTLRTIAVVGLLSVLIYIGIRIIISSTAQDKAKYKQRLIDWLVAFCLLFLMHYVMAALVTVVDKVNDVLGNVAGIDEGIALPEGYEVEYTPLGTSIGSGGSSMSSTNSLIPFTEDGLSDDEAVEKIKNELGLSEATLKRESESFEEYANTEDPMLGGWAGSTDAKIYLYEIEYENNILDIYKKRTVTYTFGGVYNETEYSYILKPKEELNGGQESNNNIIMKTDQGLYSKDPRRVLYFTNYARLMLQTKSDDKFIPKKAAYLIIYIALIVLTAVFTFRYIKRVIYIAFLTLMAPMVALTYPLDKLKDRKSTGLGYVV